MPPVDLETLRHHLRDLDVKPLAHLGAAMVQVHAAIRINMHQRAGLIERGQVERDAEFHRIDHQRLLDEGMRRVKRRDLLPPPCDSGGGFEFGEQDRRVVRADRLAIRRYVGARRVIVGAADVIGGFAEHGGDAGDHRLDGEHPLRTAETAKGGVRHRVGLAGEALDAEMRQPIDVIDMAQSPRQHRAGQISHMPGT